MKRPAVFLPLLCGIMLAGGVYLGTRLGPQQTGNDPYQKIKAVLGFVQQHYVDSVDTKKLTDKTLSTLLRHLDPHSDYFTAEEEKTLNEPLQGNFEGIGVEYNRIRDTVVVLAVVPGGPAEKMDVMPGDRIIGADGVSLVGKNSNDKFISKRLRGPAGTKVKVSILRPPHRVLDIEITRGSVPIYSVESFYMLNKDVGYIRLARFAETSYDEFRKASDSLLKSGMKKMVLDLRDNGGGLMDAATDIADEFLPEGKMIVYTKGRADGSDTIRATKKGKLENMPLVLLVNENSASASEILSGAIQDNDRGILIGRRTFGKGLVQEEHKLPDGSAFRLTVARYYTPTGRCIQKPYDKGLAAYEADEMNRYKDGELLNADSAKFSDSLVYHTPAGKIVYGGGGIMPDIFVPLDTAGGSKYLNALFDNAVFSVWSLDYIRKHRDELNKTGPGGFRRNFSVTDDMVNQLVATGEMYGVKKDANGLQRSSVLIRRYMKAWVARETWGDAAYFMTWNDDDKCVDVATATLEKK